MPTLATDDDDAADAWDGEPSATSAADAAASDALEDTTVPRGSGPATPLDGWPYRNEESTSQLPEDESMAGGAPAEPSPFIEPFEPVPLEPTAHEFTPAEPAPTGANPALSNPYAALTPRAIDADEVEEAPFTPLAPERFEDIISAAPLPAATHPSEDPGARPWASVLGQSQREETASQPDVAPASAGEHAEPVAAPAAAANDAAAEVMAPIQTDERRPAPYSPLVSSYPPVAKVEPKPDASADEDGPDAGFAGAPVTAIDAPAEGKGGSRRGRLILIIIAAALVAGVIGVLVYRTYLLPEPVTLPTPTVTAAVLAPEGEPIDVEDEESEFLAAIPRQVGVDVLMAYEAIDPVGDDSLPARAAEHIKLSYGSGVGEPVFTVHAYQHYKVEDAQTAYDAYAAGAPDIADVTVDGDVVGQRAFQAASAQGQVAWRNGTAVFVLTGPASDLLHFYERFGV
jgi:hypothetical protein